MRKKDILMSLEEISIIYQYLYMSEYHFITVDNSLAKLEIRMNENCGFHAKNLNFTDLPDLDYTDMINIPNMLGIISQLKEVEPVESSKSFKNRWGEIKEITAVNMSLNRLRL